MDPALYRAPTPLERAFLRVVTRDHAIVNEQSADCEIADYDPTGWCDVRIVSGPPAGARSMLEGPTLVTVGPTPYIETLLWTGDDGLLESIEVVVYGEPVDDVFARFVSASEKSLLRYPEPPDGSQ